MEKVLYDRFVIDFKTWIKTLRKLCKEHNNTELIPSIKKALVNAKVPNHKKESFMEYPEIADAIAALEEKFAGEGRVLIRPSGTEPKVRVMIEGKDLNEINEDAKALAELIQNTIL